MDDDRPSKTPPQTAVRFTPQEIADMLARAKEMIANPAALAAELKLQSVVMLQIIPRLVYNPPPGRSANGMQAGLIRDYVNLAEKVVGMTQEQKSPVEDPPPAE
jgi:hypothetical protein